MALLKKSAKAFTSTMRPSELVERSTHASTAARQASVTFDRRTARRPQSIAKHPGISLHFFMRPTCSHQRFTSSTIARPIDSWCVLTFGTEEGKGEERDRVLFLSPSLFYFRHYHINQTNRDTKTNRHARLLSHPHPKNIPHTPAEGGPRPRARRCRRWCRSR